MLFRIMSMTLHIGYADDGGDSIVFLSGNPVVHWPETALGTINVKKSSEIMRVTINNSKLLVVKLTSLVAFSFRLQIWIISSTY